MADVASIEVTHQSEYKGGTHLWSNRHHFNGGAINTQADWLTLETAVQAQEVAILDIMSKIVNYRGYNPGSDIPVYEHAVNVAGTLDIAGKVKPPLEVCALLRWTTDQRSIKNHPIYLFSYWHRPWMDNGADKELIVAGARDAYESYARAWRLGFTAGGQLHQRCGPRGAVAQSETVPTHAHHRDFPA